MPVCWSRLGLPDFLVARQPCSSLFSSFNTSISMDPSVFFSSFVSLYHNKTREREPSSPTGDDPACDSAKIRRGRRAAWGLQNQAFWTAAAYGNLAQPAIRSKLSFDRNCQYGAVCEINADLWLSDRIAACALDHLRTTTPDVALPGRARYDSPRPVVQPDAWRRCRSAAALYCPLACPWCRQRAT